MKKYFVVFLLMAFTMIGCEARRWRGAQDLNTVEAYESFIKYNSQSEYIPIANKRIQELKWQKQELKWQKAKQENYLFEYQKFIKDYPQSEYKSEANERIQKLLESECGLCKIAETVRNVKLINHSFSEFFYSNTFFEEKQEPELENLMNLINKCGEVMGGNSVGVGRLNYTHEAFDFRLGEYILRCRRICSGMGGCNGKHFKIYDLKIYKGRIHENLKVN